MAVRYWKRSSAFTITAVALLAAACSDDDEEETTEATGGEAGEFATGGEAGEFATGGEAGEFATGGEAGLREMGGEAGLREMGGEAGLREMGGEAGLREMGGEAGLRATGGEAGTHATGGAAGAAGAPTVDLEVVETDLVSDQSNVADNTDATLVNAWGIAINPDNDLVWVNANGSGTSNVYDTAGVEQGLMVTIPTPDGTGTSAPSGIVFNSSTDFMDDRFIFVTEDGVVAGWQSGTDAVVRADLSTDDAGLKGVAIVEGEDARQLWVADFHNGMIRVFDATYDPVAEGTGDDSHLPAGYAPFNIFPAGDEVYVAYAKQDADAHDDVAGAGLGLVDVFGTDGTFVRRLTTGGMLNSPWGMAMAPTGFGALAGGLLVGNFGDGTIHAFDVETGDLMGTLVGQGNEPIVIDGLWAIVVGPGAGGEAGLFFAAGPNDEQHGLFGVLQP
jgi:uncharacterized protein (TIGR03118 family)